MHSILGMMQLPDIQILDILNKQPEVALRLLYSSYYNYVCTVVFKLISDSSTAEDIAQEVFLEVWKRRGKLDVNASLKGYLRKIAVNKTLNHIRSKKVNFEEEEALLHVASGTNSTQKELEAKDLQKTITSAIDKLPEKCRLIFGMSRFEEMSYREISEKLGISIKTVENQMSKALKYLRLMVYEYQLENNI